MPDMVPPVTAATLRPKTGDRGRALDAAQQESRKVTVHFNPESLQLTLTNTVQKGQAGRPTQTVSESTAKLGMTLLFDTTLTGEDVRVTTSKIASMMDPVQVTQPGLTGIAQRNRKVPAVVIFEWGTITFEGYIDSYKEDLDFFSSEGVPLRASLTLSITQQERNFNARDDVAYDRSGVARQLNLSSDAQSMAHDPQQSLGSAAAAAGDPLAARQLGTANGIENLRLPGVSMVMVTGQEGQGGGSSPAGGVSGSQAAAGPFSGLRSQQAAEPYRSRTTMAVEDNPPQGAGSGIGPGTPFAIGGKANSGGSGSMGADVGVRSDLGSRIAFEE